ncbi:Lysine-specific demethylase 3B [Orchesella cincta]|uniref:[histone H3]-dimethyl-L-lysine(9) demethylase n=1 Tax=Orchesella cincta TaxID=48709 RepID=A0A1D2NGM6_ORCCI|nr:Lysine-specific demethylase 3B [Orchesella cincta]
MEPGDLRINSRLRDDSGVPRSSPSSSYGAVNEGNSVLQFRSHIRPAVITDGRLHHMPSSMAGPPLVIDRMVSSRNEPVKVWRDPTLMNSSEIRHVVSMQHSGVVHLTHPMVAHSNVNTGGAVYLHHDNKSIENAASRGPPNAPHEMRGRAPVVYAPPANAAKQHMDAWRHQAVLQQNSKDFRVNLSSKSTVEQAVHDHFVESLRLAQLKGSTSQPAVKQEERPSSHASGAHQQQRFYPPPPDKRHHEHPSSQVIYQIHQHQAMHKPELPAPPPLRSEAQYCPPGGGMESGRKHQIYGAPEVIVRPHAATQQQSSSIRYESEPDILPSDNCVRYRNHPPVPRRPTSQNDLHLERNRSPFGKPGPPASSPNSYHGYPQAHVSKHKVNSPAPPHIYGKPGPSTRPYDMSNDPSGPLPLTSKGGLTRPSQSSPTSYSHTSPSLPQHDVRKSDVAYYMYNNVPPGFQQPSLSPHAHMHSIQTQPLDLGGKRKVEDEVYKAKIQEPSDYSGVNPYFGSRKPEDPNMRPRIPQSHPHHIQNSSIPHSYTFADSMPSKRKIEEVSMSMHLDPKKVRCEAPKVSVGNVMMGRKEHEMKAVGASEREFLLDNSRLQMDNQGPLPLNMSESASKVKLEATSPAPLPFDMKKSTVKVGAVDIKPGVATITQGPLCNGKHKESTTEQKAASPPVDIKFDSQIITKVKIEAASLSAVVPKKAWVLQWHEADGSNDKTVNDDNTKVPKNDADVEVSNGCATPQSTSATENGTKDDRNGKLLNGHTLSNTESDSNKNTSVTNTQTFNGFGKERLNDSDIGSENESDNSNKEKVSTDSNPSPMKKNGRKGKDCSQASPKPDLRKDGLCKRPPVSQLKKTGESFIQAETCNRVTPKIAKCRECRWHPSARGSKKQSGAYCRFYGFRKLRYTKGGSLTVAGFSDPFTDPSKITEHDQFRLWLPSNVTPEGLSIEISKFLLSQLCDQFCDLVQQEEEARSLARTQELSEIAWKPLLKGVREMCDVCDTTLFNFHWACGKCGFVVCLSCFKARKDDSEGERAPENAGKDRDEFQWLLCSNRCAHELDKLMLVQTIAGDALTELNKKMHSICESRDIPQKCGCGNPSRKSQQEEQLVAAVKVTNEKLKSETIENSAEDKCKKSENDSDAKSKNDIDNSRLVVEEDAKTANGCSTNTDAEEGIELKYFKRLKPIETIRKKLPISQKTFATTESTVLYPNVKHSWLCDGKLLRLMDPRNPENKSIFHEQWKRGSPILVSNVTEKLDKELWTPESFSKDFGEYKNDLVDCLSGKVLANQQMKKFWEGFTCVDNRMLDDEGEPMLLKLKDWPSIDDFAQVLPSRFQDLMDALPLPEYTLRDGKLNLAARLPAEFMKPDLGPKLCIAYGSGEELDKATTNLQLDVSDAVNVLVHCEPSQDEDATDYEKAVLDAIKESDCDVVTINRVLQKKEVPGALWHVYDAKDADKIRDLLNKVAVEKGASVEPHHDAIHDQSWYLDKTLRKRLMTEYNVCGYPILQCAGDAIFIPAGAPHQVRNLQNCIKVAEDFVSPENISHSFYLTEELRNLSKDQPTFEDKLQIKNIVYHAVKDAAAVLLLQTTEKSETAPQNSQEDASTALSKDCQFHPSTSPQNPAALVVNSATN